jgi:RNA 3'-terminal phosphate cyclase (ATP)
MNRIRGKRPRSGMRPQHVMAARAASMACQARVSGLYEGSLELKFEPHEIVSGDYHFEIGTAGAATLVMQTVIPALARAASSSRVEVFGGTHVPASPSYHYLTRHWSVMVAQAGLKARAELKTAGFYPRGGGLLTCVIDPWKERRPLLLERRGRLLSLHGISASARLKGDVARRRLWESRRLEAQWDVMEVEAPSPGSFIHLDAVFEGSRAAFGGLGERGLRAEALADRVVGLLLDFLESKGAVDPHLADQLVVPMALGAGGRITTPTVTRHLETVVAIASVFGAKIRLWSQEGGAGGFEVEGS